MLKRLGFIVLCSGLLQACDQEPTSHVNPNTLSSSSADEAHTPAGIPSNLILDPAFATHGTFSVRLANVSGICSGSIQSTVVDSRQGTWLLSLDSSNVAAGVINDVACLRKVQQDGSTQVLHRIALGGKMKFDIAMTTDGNKLFIVAVGERTSTLNVIELDANTASELRRATLQVPGNPWLEIRSAHYQQNALIVAGVQLGFDEHRALAMRLSVSDTSIVIDETFGDNGVFLHLPDGAREAAADNIAVSSQGNLVLTGTSKDDVQRITVWRLSPQGHLDPTFNEGKGYQTYQDEARNHLSLGFPTSALDPQGRLVIVSTLFSAEHSFFDEVVAFRLEPNSHRRDATLAQGGVVYLGKGGTLSRSTLVISADGAQHHFLMLGRIGMGKEFRIAGFTQTGSVYAPLSVPMDYGKMTTDAIGRLIVAGTKNEWSDRAYTHVIAQRYRQPYRLFLPLVTHNKP